ncbi:MAG TPA: hypothetical protein VFD76_09540, partial [Gemmatimonadales bacterium]|nr:hypothetical protein [Gemmatimonadales bacterium]
PWNQRELLAGLQYVMATTDAGAHWTKLSPDLGYAKGVTPPPDSLRGRPGQPVAGAIEALSASPVARGEIWVGTNNGLIELTRNEGKSWEYVSIPNLPDSTRADISSIDASHLDPAEAYVAVDLHRTGDYHPYLYRTRDYGRTWTLIVTGLPADQPSGSFARVIRGDTEKAGLLFAGTESGMYVSFDDGDHWQSLQLNLPNTSCRDLVIKGNDLVVGTYGRGIWVLDDFSPLRQIASASEPVHLFAPGDAVRVRRNVGWDTPFPPEVPHALNPPDGALIYYYLAAKPAGEITLDVLDSTGAVVRHMSSAPITPVAEAARPPEPNFWLATPEPLPTAVGTNRANWDVRYDAPPALTHTFEINANPGLTPPSPVGPLALPGTYTVRLTVDGQRYTQTVKVRNDPRSPASFADLRAQHALQMKVHRALQQTSDRYHEVTALRAAVAADTAAAPAEVATAAKALDSTLAAVAGNPDSVRGFGRGAAQRPPTFASVDADLVRQINGLETGDLAPTEAMQRDYDAACTDLTTAVAAWAKVASLLTQHHLQAVATATAPPVPACSTVGGRR